MPTVAVNGIDIYYELHGEGPPLMYISGTGNDLRRSPASILPVNRWFETLSYDQRGLGRTSKPGGDYSMADYADDAAALVRSMGWEHCHVMGVSFGGMVALNLAQRHPDLIDRLVLGCTSAGGASASYPLHELGRLEPDEAFATRMRLNDSRWDPDAEEPIPGLGRYYDQMVESARSVPDPEQLAGLGRQLRARAGHDVQDALASIEQTTLVCAGEYDGIAPVANSVVLADRLPNATLRVFDGGHTFLVQDRTAFPEIIDFLRSES
ncbi:MAG: alpha/beta hydrolase [Acidimicrobiales bacterium]|nr:MAG: alpha/beta hydrolase [Acidimicrobiales bacterium]